MWEIRDYPPLPDEYITDDAGVNHDDDGDDASLETQGSDHGVDGKLGREEKWRGGGGGGAVFHHPMICPWVSENGDVDDKVIYGKANLCSETILLPSHTLHQTLPASLPMRRGHRTRLWTSERSLHTGSRDGSCLSWTAHNLDTYRVPSDTRTTPIQSLGQRTAPSGWRYQTWPRHTMGGWVGSPVTPRLVCILPGILQLLEC